MTEIHIVSSRKQPLKILLDRYMVEPEYNIFEKFLGFFGYKKERIMPLPNTNEWFTN